MQADNVKEKSQFCEFCRQPLSTDEEKKLGSHEECSTSTHDFWKSDEYKEALRGAVKYDVSDNMLWIDWSSASMYENDEAYANAVIDYILKFEPEEAKNIRIVHLSKRNLLGIPESVFKLANVKELDISYNVGIRLSEDLAKLSKLSTLKMNRCELISLPENILAAHSLRYIELYGNKISKDADFSILSKLPHLQGINLSSNELEKLPKGILSIKGLLILNLSFNKLSSIPEEISSCSNLTELDLRGNKLTRLPNELCKLTNLRTLELSHNELSSLPEDIGALHKLNELAIFTNKIWDLPKSTWELRKLKRLDLSFNLLSNISGIGNIAKLRELFISGNCLREIPKEICNLKDLSNLHMQYNSIASLPRDIFGLPKLRYVKMEKNEVKKIPRSIKNAHGLIELSIDTKLLRRKLRKRFHDEYMEKLGQFPGMPHLDNLKIWTGLKRKRMDARISHEDVELIFEDGYGAEIAKKVVKMNHRVPLLDWAEGQARILMCSLKDLLH